MSNRMIAIKVEFDCFVESAIRIILVALCISRIMRPDFIVKMTVFSKGYIISVL